MFWTADTLADVQQRFPQWTSSRGGGKLALLVTMAASVERRPHGTKIRCPRARRTGTPMDSAFDRPD